MKFLLRFLRWFCHPDLIEDVEGDLMELYQERSAKSGRHKAKWLFVWDVVKLFRPSIIRNLGSQTQLNNYGMLKNHFKIARRSLVKSKSSSLINISGLSIGIAVCLIIFIVIKHETSFDKYHQNEARIYRVLTEYHHEGADVFYGNGLPYALPQELGRSFPGIEKVSAIYTDTDAQMLVLDGNGSSIKKFKEENGVFFAEPSLFDILDYEWLAGSASSLRDPNNVVLTKETAEKYFSNWENSIGKTIRWNDSETLTITGILETIPTNSDLQFKAVIAYGTGYTSRYLKSDNWNGTDGALSCYVLLHPNVSESDVNTRLKLLASEKKTGRNRDSHILQSLSKIHYGDLNTENYSGKTISHQLISVLWIIGAFILLIACVNFINLSTAKAVTRSKEIGVRKVLGSTKGLLKAQFLIETYIIVTISMIVASFLVFLTLPHIGQVLDLPLTIEVLFSLKTLLVLIAASVIITFFAGFYPALILAKFDPMTALKNQAKRGSNKGITLRRSLVVFQFSIAQVLIIGTLIIVKQMDYFTNQSMGYNKDATINISFPTDSIGLRKTDHLGTTLLSVGGIQNVSFSSDTPTENRGRNSWTSFKYDNAAEDVTFYAIRKGVDSEYLSTYELPLVAGRNIKKTFETTEFLVNERLVESLEITDPQEVLNKEISIWGGRIKGRIVGVIKNYHTRSFADGIDPVLMSNQKKWFSQASIKFRTDNISGVIASIEKLWDEVYPKYVFEYEFLDVKIASFYVEEQRLSQMYQLFATIAIFLSCLGLYGLVSFMAEQRTKEVGIRKVLGASIINVIYLFSKEFMVLIAIGFAISAPIAWYFMNEWLQGYVYHIDLSWLVFIVGGLLSAIIAQLTVGFQAIKVAKTNPVDSLRNE